MIRPTVPADTPTLLALAEGTGVFKPHEIVALREVLDDYHAANHGEGHSRVTAEEDGQVVGFAYYAPAAMTDRTWYLYWIAVRQDSRPRASAHDSCGTPRTRSAEIKAASCSSRRRRCRTTSRRGASTSSTSYEQTAVLRDFYADGDDMVCFASA